MQLGISLTEQEHTPAVTLDWLLAIHHKRLEVEAEAREKAAKQHG